jgi:hypothetical protein
MPFYYDKNKIRQAQKQSHERLTLERRFPAIIQDSSDLDPATNKVRVYREDIRKVVIVNSLVRQPGTPVWLEFQPDKELAVFAIRIPEGSAVYGGALGAASLPTGGLETVPLSVTGLQFTPGRVEPSQLGGLYTHVRSFRYDGGYWDDGSLAGEPTLHDFDLTADLTAASGYSQWMLICFDPDVPQLVAIPNTPVAGDVTVLDEAAIDPGAIPAGMYYLGAVAVANGQTNFDDSPRFPDLRRFLTPEGVVIADLTGASDGDVLTVQPDGSVAPEAPSPVNLPYSTANVSNPPTAAQLIAAFGTAASVGEGFAALLNDNGAGANEYLCWSDGANWFYVAGTLAV